MLEIPYIWYCILQYMYNVHIYHQYMYIVYRYVSKTIRTYNHNHLVSFDAIWFTPLGPHKNKFIPFFFSHCAFSSERGANNSPTTINNSTEKSAGAFTLSYYLFRMTGSSWPPSPPPNLTITISYSKAIIVLLLQTIIIFLLSKASRHPWS